MKKILLPALFCGFVLNHGYCFDEEHRITNEYLDRSFYQLIEIEKKLMNLCDTINVNATLMYEESEFLSPLIGMFNNICYKIRHNLETFGPEFFKIVIPSGDDKGKTVEDLLREHRLNNDHMQMICDDSVKYNVEDSGDRVTFELIRIEALQKDCYNTKEVEFCASLGVPSLGLGFCVELE